MKHIVVINTSPNHMDWAINLLDGLILIDPTFEVINESSKVVFVVNNASDFGDLLDKTDQKRVCEDFVVRAKNKVDVLYNIFGGFELGSLRFAYNFYKDTSVERFTLLQTTTVIHDTRFFTWAENVDLPASVMGSRQCYMITLSKDQISRIPEMVWNNKYPDNEEARRLYKDMLYDANCERITTKVDSVHNESCFIMSLTKAFGAFKSHLIGLRSWQEEKCGRINNVEAFGEDQSIYISKWRGYWGSNARDVWDFIQRNPRTTQHDF